MHGPDRKLSAGVRPDVGDHQVEYRLQRRVLESPAWMLDSVRILVERIGLVCGVVQSDLDQDTTFQTRGSSDHRSSPASGNIAPNKR